MANKDKDVLNKVIDKVPFDTLKGIDLKEIVKPLLTYLIDVLKVNKEKAAATLLALPTCFEYGVIANKAYVKPNLKTTKEYYSHLKDIWLS